MGLTSARAAVTAKGKSQKPPLLNLQLFNRGVFIMKNISHKMGKITIKQLSANRIPAG
jgi:hypothetical protein